MTIIEGVPTVPELVATSIPSMDLGRDLFRSDKCPDRSTSAWQLGSWVAGPRTASPATSIGSASTPGRSSLSYANAASSNSSPPPQISLPIAPKPAASRAPKAQYQQIPPQQPDWDPGHRGLDEPITVSVSAMESIKKRKESDKLCNNHFLRGPCTKGDSCFFVHDYKPSSEEINAIAVLARQNPCTNGQDCESDECIYGHHVRFLSFFFFWPLIVYAPRACTWHVANSNSSSIVPQHPRQRLHTPLLQIPRGGSSPRDKVQKSKHQGKPNTMK